MAKKTESEPKTPVFDVVCYGYAKNLESGNMDIITIRLDNETNECEIERDEQKYTEPYRALRDITKMMADDFIKGNKK